MILMDGRYFLECDNCGAKIEDDDFTGSFICPDCGVGNLL